MSASVLVSVSSKPNLRTEIDFIFVVILEERLYFYKSGNIYLMWGAPMRNKIIKKEKKKKKWIGLGNAAVSFLIGDLLHLYTYCW